MSQVVVSALGRFPAAPGADLRRSWSEAFKTVRAETERRAAPLSPEDQIVQSMADASPTKWHRAHTTWFFEQFLLKEHVAIANSIRGSAFCSTLTMLRQALGTPGRSVACSRAPASKRSQPTAPMSMLGFLRCCKAPMRQR
jgi:hypothetical protein